MDTMGGMTHRQETRHFDENSSETSSLRTKEYPSTNRYFPEPDLPPVEPAADWIERIRGSLPELPAARRAPFADRVGLTSCPSRVPSGAYPWVACLSAAGTLGVPPSTAAYRFARARTDPPP